MLQEGLLVDADLVELVQIDQEETPQVAFGIPLATEIQTVRITETQFGWEQYPAESGLAIALRTDEHWCCGIAMLLVTPQPMCHHAQEPTVEQIVPMRMTAHHSIRQFTDAVTPVPFTEFIQIFLHGVIDRHIFGMQETVDVPVPGLNTFLQGMDSDAVSCPLVQCSEAETDAVPFAVFQIFCH